MKSTGLPKFVLCPSAMALLFLAFLLPLATAGVAVGGPPVPAYDSIPAPLPPNLASLGYEATGTQEFGDLVQFASASNWLTSATVTMSTWAPASSYPSFSGPSWSLPITLNIYHVDNSGANPAPGALIATRTQTFVIPWRPEPDPTCADPSYWRASNGTCYGGMAVNVTFDLTGTNVPSQVIYSVAFDTEHYGYSPIGARGPYNSFNVALASVPPTVGTNPFPDTAYWNTVVAGFYSDGGAGGSGTFRRDTAWAPYSVAARFDALAAADAPIPTLDPRGLAAMAALIGAAGLLQVSRGRSAGV